MATDLPCAVAPYEGRPMSRRRLPRDLRYAPNKVIAHLWLRRGGKRHVRRLERRAAKDTIRKDDAQ